MNEFIAKDGNKYFIDLDDGENITVFNSDKRKVGSITLMQLMKMTTD